MVLSPSNRFNPCHTHQIYQYIQMVINNTKHYLLWYKSAQNNLLIAFGRHDFRLAH